MKHQLQRDRRQNDEQRMLESEEEEEELDVTIEEDEEQAVSELWEAWDGELTMLQAKIQNNDELKKRRAKGLESLSLPTRCSQVGSHCVILFPRLNGHLEMSGHLLSRVTRTWRRSSRERCVRRGFVCSRGAKSCRRD